MLPLILLWWLIYVPIERFLRWCNAAVFFGGLLAGRLRDNGCHSIQHLVSGPPRGWNIPFAVGSLIYLELRDQVFIGKTNGSMWECHAEG